MNEVAAQRPELVNKAAEALSICGRSVDKLCLSSNLVLKLVKALNMYVRHYVLVLEIRSKLFVALGKWNVHIPESKLSYLHPKKE